MLKTLTDRPKMILYVNKIDMAIVHAIKTYGENTFPINQDVYYRGVFLDRLYKILQTDIKGSSVETINRHIRKLSKGGAIVVNEVFPGVIFIGLKYQRVV